MENRPPLPPFTQKTAEENVQLAENGLMQRRITSINDKPINKSDRELI